MNNLTFPPTLEMPLKALLKDEYSDFMTAMGKSPHGGLRFNSGKVKGEEWLSLGLNTSVPWAEYGYYAGLESLSKHPFHHGGIFYMQEPSAMLPAEVLHPKEGDWVIDLCAAPGGKSTRLSEFLKGTGFFVANDISNSRCRGLFHNMERFGMVNAVVTNETPQRLAEHFGNVFNKVLVDAPCSGQGMFRKDPKLLKEYVQRTDRCFPQWQKEILDSAADLTADGGSIVYSTCTFTKDENEEIIAAFLETHHEFSLEEIPKEYGFVGGVDGLHQAVRLYPHRVKGEGHFVAHLKRCGTSEKKPLMMTERESIPQVFSAFCAENEIKVPCGMISEHKNSLYLRSCQIPSVSGLKVVGVGTYLGDIKNNRFTPSHAFALSLREDDVVPRFTFDCSDKKVADYLKGLTLKENVKKGYHLMFANGFSLGWVKSDGNGTLKNHYPKAWRNIS